MDSAFLFVAGNGQTSKNNIEALLNDYIVPLKQQNIKPVIVPIVLNRASEGQVIAAKFAREKGLDCVVYTPDASRLSAFPAADFHEAKEPLKEACKLYKGATSKVYGFLLWDDEDQDSADALVTLSAKGIGCYDLTNGLTDITPVAGLKPPKKRAEAPEQEQLTPEEEDAPEDPVEASEEYSAEEEVLMETIYDAIYEIAKLAIKRARRDS
jgi:hypothetical protein